MDIRIGAPSRVGPPGDRSAAPQGSVEARILAIRKPRRRRGSGGGQPEGVERRAGQQRNDPPGGRVLILMIPDAGKLPPALESGAYRVFLRFVRR